MTKKLRKILKFAKFGMAVLPVRAGGKVPELPGGVYSATKNKSDLRRYFALHPTSNYGVATGSVSSVFVLDLDGAAGGKSLRRLEQTHTKLPATVTVETPHGRHLYFLSGERRIRNSVKKLGAGLDVRGDGGYVVGPGSVGSDGTIYRFRRDSALGQIPIAAAPNWLFDLVEKPESESSVASAPKIAMSLSQLDRARRYGEAAQAAELHRLARAQKHHRNDALNKCAFRLGQLLPHGIIDEREISRQMEGIARQIGLDDPEIMPTIKSGLAAGGLYPRRLPPFAEAAVEQPQVFDVTSDADQLTAKLSIYGETDTDNAQRLAERFGHRLIYTNGRGWLTYDGSRWRRDSISQCIELAKQTARRIGDEAAILSDPPAKAARVKFAKASLSKGALERMLDLTKGLVEVDDAVLDAEPFLLNVKNGTVDLRTGVLRPHDPGDYLTKIAPVAADVNAKCPHFKQLVRRVTGGDKKLARYLRSCAGYSLTGNTREQVFFFVFGKWGNGKSTFVNTICDLLGEYGVRTPTESLMVKQFDNAIPNDIARLDGARMIAALETNVGRQLDEAKIKSFTGGEKVTARFMRREYFEFTPQGKIWFVANDRPRVRGTDKALWRRIRVLPFNAQISGAADEEKDFASRLRDEFPGILAWAMRGCLAWQKEGLCSPPVVTGRGQRLGRRGRPCEAVCERRSNSRPRLRRLRRDRFRRIQDVVRKARRKCLVRLRSKGQAHSWPRYHPSSDQARKRMAWR